MSTIKANAAQIGQSATPTNNFTLYQPAVPDGTVRLGNGNAGSVTDVVTVTSAGNVGIGTSSPVYRLDVRGGSAAIINSAADPTLFVGEGLGVNEYGFLRWDRTNNILKVATQANPITFGSDATEWMRIDSSGNVGIGTSSPNAKLEVNGSIKANALLPSGGIFVVASGSYNNNSVNSLGAVMQESMSVIHISTGGTLSSIPVYTNGGGGVAYVFNYMNPATAGWTNTSSGVNFSFTNAGSAQNTYNVVISNGNGTLTIQRTSGSTAYSVYVQRFASAQ